MNITDLFAAAIAQWIAMALIMSIAWFIERRTGNSGWIDVMWTSGIGLVGLVAALSTYPLADVTNRQLLVAAMVSLWAVRLAGHIAKRSASISDDPRYASLRKQWGDAVAWKMFYFLQVQAVCAIPMLITISLAAWRPGPIGLATDFIGGVVFAIGIVGSSAADRQLSEFKNRADTSGKVCDIGLWSWSRHPNYFFEWVVWLGLAIIALDLTMWNWSWGLVALAGPACMFWLLRYVSGVPPLEDHMEEKYGQSYRDYQARTSAFFPSPPTRSAKTHSLG